MDFKKYSNGSWTDTPVYKYNKTAAGAPNLLQNNLTSKEANGLTITVNGDSITINGTATANTNINIYNDTVGSVLGYQQIGKGVYVIDGNPPDAVNNQYILSARYKSTESGTSTILRFPVGESLTIDNSNGSYNYFGVYVAVWIGQTLDNVVFRPTLKPVADSWYQIQAYKRVSGSWTADPPTTKRIRKKKAVTEKIKEDEI